MESYWFKTWLGDKGIRDAPSLRRALAAEGIDDFLQVAAQSIVDVEAATDAQLSAGKGIDLTGRLGCRHIDCLKAEVDGLFRHLWLYFDKVRMPDQALSEAEKFSRHKDINRLVDRLEPFILVLDHLDAIDAIDLLTFEYRKPSCKDHFREHAEEAGIAQAIENTKAIEADILERGELSWEISDKEGHPHLDYRVDYDGFEHSRWGTLCGFSAALPKNDEKIRRDISKDIVRDFLAELCADALAARQSRTALGSTIAFYRRLLATNPSPKLEDVAFELALPVANNIPLELLVHVRRSEGPSFERFQFALRQAISERLKQADDPDPTAIAREIKETIISPGLREIRDKLQTAGTYALKTAGMGIALGTASATIGLLSPLAKTPLGSVLAAGGAVTLAGGGLKSAAESYLGVKREVLMSDMYFLWKAHGH